MTTFPAAFSSQTHLYVTETPKTICYIKQLSHKFTETEKLSIQIYWKISVFWFSYIFTVKHVILSDGCDDVRIVKSCYYIHNFLRVSISHTKCGYNAQDCTEKVKQTSNKADVLLSSLS